VKCLSNTPHKLRRSVAGAGAVSFMRLFGGSSLWHRCRSCHVQVGQLSLLVPDLSPPVPLHDDAVCPSFETHRWPPYRRPRGSSARGRSLAAKLARSSVAPASTLMQRHTPRAPDLDSR
jgi:hypothetical protein